MAAADIAQQIEALLFVLGEPLSRKELAEMLRTDIAQVEEGIKILSAQSGRGITLVDDGKTVELRSAPEVSTLIERIRKEEYARDIGKAGLEALAAVLYRGPLTRSQIDFIRGVNSSQTLRTLAMRGLVRKVPNPTDERSFLYEPTTELLSTLGISRTADLPDYDTVRERLNKLEAEQKAQQEQASAPEESSEES